MNISAVILAAGRSTRMGQQKMLLPWGNTSVLGKVIEVLLESSVKDIIVATNTEIEAHVPRTARVVINENGGMLQSIQLGIQAQHDSAEAMLVCLGDQPQIEERSARSVCEAFLNSRSNIVVPSHQMRRGHPWLVARPLWNEIASMSFTQTPRDFLNNFSTDIEYIEVNTPTILQDLDTPEDYLKFKPAV